MKRRTAVVTGVAGVLAAAGVTAGLADATSGSRPAAAASNSSVPATATVVLTNLSSTIQQGGSLGYSGSYVIAALTGQSSQQVAQAQQAVAQAQNTVSQDETALTNDRASGDQAVAAAQAAVDSAVASLTADQAGQARACAGRGASSPACSQATPKVGHDQQQLTQAEQQLSTAEANLSRTIAQDEAHLSLDTAQLQNAESALAAAEDAEANPGTAYTSLPTVGQTVSRDQPVYALNGEPVPLLYGSVPAYRAFHLGMSDGSDVGELTQNLIALGFGSGLTQSDHFSSATASAIEAWQQSLGLPQTGKVLLGAVVFEPGAIRVTSVTPSVGQSVAPGAILDATSTNREVDIALPVTQEYLVKPGDAVTVVLPNGATQVTGHIKKVSDVAVCPGGSGTGNGNGNSNAGQGNQGPLDCSSSGGNSGSSSPTVAVTISLDNPAASGTLDQAPVNVDITTERANHVLAVPIAALLALQEGGYGVDVVANGTTHLVGVQTGLFSDSMVQVSGPGITAGTVVEVPSQ